MRWLKEYKEVLLQIIVFTAIGFLFHKTWMIGIAGVLVLILPFHTIIRNYIIFLNKIINYTGFLIKTTLFFLLFTVVIIPISLILKIKKKQNRITYIPAEHPPEKLSFLKLW